MVWQHHCCSTRAMASFPFCTPSGQVRCSSDCQCRSAVCHLSTPNLYLPASFRTGCDPSCVDKDLRSSRENAYKWLAGFLETLPQERADRYGQLVVEALTELLRLEDSNRAREQILIALQNVMAWQSASIEDRALTKVQGTDHHMLTDPMDLPAIVRPESAAVHSSAKASPALDGVMLQMAAAIKYMYERTKGISDTVKGELLSSLGTLLNLKPALFSPSKTDVNAFNSQWLLQETDRLVRLPTTAAALRTGALAGLCSALSTFDVRFVLTNPVQALWFLICNVAT